MNSKTLKNRWHLIDFEIIVYCIYTAWNGVCVTHWNLKTVYWNRYAFTFKRFIHHGKLLIYIVTVKLMFD